MIFKIVAYGVRGYVRDAFNLFDGILVVISVSGIALEVFNFASIGVNVVTVFRSLRVLRIFKLASRSDSLLILLEAIRTTVKEIMNYLLLLFLFIFIFALLGMELYAYRVRVDEEGNPLDDLKDPNGLVPDQNFDTFFQAMLTVFCLLVNEDWHITLYQYTRASNRAKAFFYIGTCVIIGNFLLLQLFLALLIQNFSNATASVIEERKAEKAKEKWLKLRKALFPNKDPDELMKDYVPPERKKKTEAQKLLSEFPFLFDFMFSRR